jgi:hypothetical protein
MSKRARQEAKQERGEPSAMQERLNWRLAWRDDARVAQALYAGEEIEEIHDLSDAGLLDEFFVFLEQVGMMAVLERLNLPNVQRVVVPTVQLVLLYLLKVLVDGQSMNELPRVLRSRCGTDETGGVQCAASGRGVDAPRR